MQSKYSINPGDTRYRSGILLYRIVRADGARGGYVQTEANLSQEGTCWLHDDSEAFGEARITQNAQVYGQVFGRALVSGDCRVTGQVFDSATVAEHAEIMGRAYGSAVVRGYARVMGEALDNAVVEGRAMILGRIGGYARAGGNDIVVGDRTAPPPAAPGAAPGDFVARDAGVTLKGYAAPTLVEGSVRIYLDPAFSSHVDIPEPGQNIVSWTEIDKSSGLIHLSIKPTARVSFGRTIRSIPASAL